MGVRARSGSGRDSCDGVRRHDPAGARALLDAAWDTETPDDRVSLLGALEVGLTGDDEPLLERALDDRRREVRAVAIDLLARLPDRAYVRRMAARARACVDPAPVGRTVAPPAECDASMRRDGIAAKPPAGTGERAWWLEEVLARTPLAVWPAPEVFLGRPIGRGMDGDRAPRAGPGRRRPTRHRLGRGPGRRRWSPTSPPGAGPTTGCCSKRCTTRCPPTTSPRGAGDALRRGLAGATAVGVEHVLALCPRPWPPAVADAVFGALDEALAAPWRRLAARPGCASSPPCACRPSLAPRAAALAERLRTERSA